MKKLKIIGFGLAFCLLLSFAAVFTGLWSRDGIDNALSFVIM
jgi:hypothetical protein